MKNKNKLILAGVLALAFALASNIQAASTLTNGLVAHLTFDNLYTDSSGNGNDAEPVNSPTFDTGQIGKAVHITIKMDGSVTNFVTLNYPSSFKFGSDATGDTRDFSMSFWVKILEHAGDQPFIANKDWDSGGNLGFVIANEDDGLKWNYKDDVNGRRDSPHVAPQLEDTNWHNVAVTFERQGNGSIYVDGRLVNQTSIAPDAGNAIGSVDTDSLGYRFNLGDDGRGDYALRDQTEIEMLMDDVGIWRRAITSLEVASIYAGGLAGQDLAHANVKILPQVKSLSPTPDTKGAAANTAIIATLQDADTVVATNTIQLAVDNTTVTPTVTKTTNVTTVVYSSTNLFAPLSTHTVKLTYSDNSTPANQVTTNWSFTVLNYGILPASFAQPAGAVATGTPGFKMRVHQIDSTSAGALPANAAHAEAQLAGLLIDPATGQPYANTATAGEQPDGSYGIAGVLNFSFDPSSDQGNFTSANGYAEAAIPGLAGTDANNLAVEILTYVQLAAGYYRFGVSSSDGFRVTVGPNARDVFSTALGLYDTRRVTGDTTFDFAVQQAGFYSMRIVWFRQSDMPNNGSSKGSLELYNVTPTGQKILVNDSTNPQAIKAFQNSTATYPPYVKYAGPTAFISDYRGADFGLTNVQIQISDGSSAKVDTGSLTLTIDGTAVTPVVTSATGLTTLTYTPPGLQLPRKVHSAQLVYGAAGGGRQTNTWQFNGLRNYILPAPLYAENFDTTDEGTFPTGWVEENFTGHQDAGMDPTDLKSDYYLGWALIGLDNGAPLTKVTGVAPFQELNGKLFDTDTNPLMNNHFVYAESDARQNGPPGQIQYLTTPSYNLTGKTGVVIAFTSAYEQNQDALACLEYSVDGGTNWNPVFYWVQGDDDTQGPSDILRDVNGNVDAVATMTTSYGDVARYTDSTGKLVGGYYGFFIKAPITQALAPYIEGRINDDGAESKRIEVFQVPLADNKANVKFRFVQAGTSSWYWGVDNWGVYSVPSLVPAQLGSLSIANSNGQIIISWTGGGTLQSTPALGTTWTTVPNNPSSPYTVTPTDARQFYRLSQ